MAKATSAGALRLNVVCDQVRGNEHQTVYFGSDRESFGAGETRQVRLPLVTQASFQPQPWADISFTGYRNEYVGGLKGRRSTPVPAL